MVTMVVIGEGAWTARWTGSLKGPSTGSVWPSWRLTRTVGFSGLFRARRWSSLSNLPRSKSLPVVDGRKRWVCWAGSNQARGRGCRRPDCSTTPVHPCLPQHSLPNIDHDNSSSSISDASQLHLEPHRSQQRSTSLCLTRLCHIKAKEPIASTYQLV